MSLSNFTEKELVSAYINGNELAIEQLILTHKNRVFSYIVSKVRDEELAEDIFQDTFIKVINTIKKGKYNDEGKFLPWVMRIAHNLIIDHYRKSSRMPLVKGNEDFDIFDIITCPNKNVQDKIESDQLNDRIKKLIKHLPNDQKEVLMMRLYFDMSFKEISELTNVSINTALGRMRYALINLRKMAEEKNIT
ncbi:MAG: sigma-70 family RNA polymerase sigma factor, partial [Flavobacteriales bacterium]|nr:sigma-70 family RNA polymerase sigma factor [Flavobacteriales bacterium]